MTSLTGGGFHFEPDGVISVDAAGLISCMCAASDYAGSTAPLDIRPLVICPGLVDTHAHLPQMPLTGTSAPGALMDWLEEEMAPAERRFSGSGSLQVAESYLQIFASVGTTTVTLYSSVDADATDAGFRAAAAHGMRAVLGQCLMDKMRYDDAPESGITDRRLSESESLCRRWHGYDNGRLQYAFTPRFALSCSPQMLRESARLATHMNAFWQTHVAEDPDEVAQALALFPGIQSYLDIYDRFGGLGSKSILAHGVYLSDGDICRIRESHTSIAHCPSNVFGNGGVLDLGRYRESGVTLGLGSDVGGCTDVSLFKAMEIGWICQATRKKLVPAATVLNDVADWFDLATLGGARVLGLADRIGSLEVGKEADLIAVDTDRLRVTNDIRQDSASSLLCLMVFRARQDMIRAAWVRGKRLVGPGMFDHDSSGGKFT